jgi:MFS transporter, DHA1 family, inner membrane transport protein
MTQPASAPPETAPMSAVAKRTLLALSAGNFTVGIAAFVVLGLMTTITRDVGAPASETAHLVTFYAIAYAIGSPLLIAVTGTYSRRGVMTGAMAVVALGCLACALSPTLSGMKAARILTAFGAGLFSPATAAVAVSLMPPERRGWALSYIFIGFTAAQGIGNPIGAWLGYTFGWRWTFLVVSAMAAAMTAIMWRAVPAETEFRPTSLAELGRVLTTPHLLIALLFTVAFVAASYTTLTFLTLILETRLGLGGTGISLVLAVFGCMAFAAAVLSGPITDKYGPSRVLLVLCALLAILLPLVTQGPAEPIALTIIIGAWSLSSWFHFTAQQSRLVAIAPPLAQLLLALNSSMLYVGISTGSVLSARLLPIPDFKGLAVGAVILVVLAAVILVFGDGMIARQAKAPLPPTS